MADKTKHTRFSDVVSVIKSSDIEALKCLLKNKHVGLIGDKLETVLHVAARLGDVDVIRTLLEDWRVTQLLDHVMYNGDTALKVAVRNNNVGALKVLGDYGGDIWQQRMEADGTVLHFAASQQSSELLNILIALNPPLKVINLVNIYGETALDLAIMHSSANVGVLLQAGAEYSEPNIFNGRNVFHTSVAYKQCGVLQELIASQNSRKLANLADRRGDTPLMLAVKTGCLECVQVLMKFVKVGKEINEVTGESLLHMAVQTDSDRILSYLLMFSNEYVINYKDFEGRTPLILAIESKKYECLERLMNTQNVYEKNKITHETALHTAIRVDNSYALKLLVDRNNHAGSWCFSQKNREGKTPFWVAVESDHAQFVTEARKKCWVDINELNHQGDSCMFVAAAYGNLKVLKVLLLSEKFYSFCRACDKYSDFKVQALVREAEISCDIYSSDIFILTDEIRRNRSHSWFPSTFFNVNKTNGRNIFHACALGCNVYCLDFVYKFVQLFNHNSLSLFDSPDVFGNTPLLLATRNDLDNSGCVYYFLLNNANISRCNNEGDYVLESILINTENSTDLIMSLLNEGITYNQEAKGLQQESESLHIDFSIFKPPDEPITKVVRLFYDKLHGEQRHKVLQHTLFNTYVYLVLNSVTYFFIVRFVISCLSTLLLTVYLIFFSHSSEGPIIFYIRCCLGILNALGLLFSIPLLVYIDLRSIIGIITITLMVSPCLLVLGLIMVPHGSDLSFEIAAITVIIAFSSLMMYSITTFKQISLQIAMLSQVIYGLFSYAGTVFFVLWTFSVVFYCIFNNSFYFVSLFKSFIYTTNILLLYDTVDSYQFFEEKHFNFNTSHSDGSIRTSYEVFAQQLDLYFECAILLIFTIAVNLGLTNMLISLAVRGGKTLETSGSIFQRHLQIHWLSNLEMFLKSFIYKLLKNTPFIYLFGIIPSRTFIDVEIKYYPLFHTKPSGFTKKSVGEIKRTFGKSMGNILEVQRSNTLLLKKFSHDSTMTGNAKTTSKLLLQIFKRE